MTKTLYSSISRCQLTCQAENAIIRYQCLEASAKSMALYPFHHITPVSMAYCHRSLCIRIGEIILDIPKNFL